MSFLQDVIDRVAEGDVEWDKGSTFARSGGRQTACAYGFFAMANSLTFTEDVEVIARSCDRNAQRVVAEVIMQRFPGRGLGMTIYQMDGEEDINVDDEALALRVARIADGNIDYISDAIVRFNDHEYTTVGDFLSVIAAADLRIREEQGQTQLNLDKDQQDDAHVAEISTLADEVLAEWAEFLLSASQTGGS